MSEMVERVARILFRQARGVKCAPLDAAWRDYEADAREVVEAMREPTEAMINKPKIDCWEQSYVYENQINEIWQAMIDEALR